MHRIIALLGATALLTLTGCGLAETGAVGAAGAASQVQQASQAKATEDRVRQQLDAAAQQAAEQRKTAESESQ